MSAYMLPVYLLALAGFLVFMNIKAASAPAKWVSYVGMWAALVGSVVTAIGAYR